MIVRFNLERGAPAVTHIDDARILANTGRRGSSQRIMKPLWKFAQYGQAGRWASDLFPETNKHLDDLTLSCFHSFLCGLAGSFETYDVLASLSLSYPRARTGRPCRDGQPQ